MNGFRSAYEPIQTPLALAGVLLIAGLTLLVYLPSLHGDFILDDERYVTENPHIASSDGLYRIWCTNQLIDYWPLTYTTFWFEWRLWGMNPTGYRVTNLLLHIITALLAWMIFRELSIPGAFLAALLFAVHPVNVESVAWISQRKEMLAALFFMLSILWYLRREEKRSEGKLGVASACRWYWLSLLAFALAMLSKSSAATLPLVLVLIVWWLHERVTKWDFCRLLPYFCVAALLTLVEIWFQTRGDPHAHASFDERLCGAGAVVWFYLSKALLPIDLTFIYPHWNIRTGHLLWWLPLLATLGVTALLWRRHNSPQTNSRRALFFAWGFFCVALAPVMGFAEVGGMRLSLAADRYEHIALIGVVALVAAAWSYWHESVSKPAQSVASALATVVVGGLVVLTWQQSRLFGDRIKLYQATLAVNSFPLATIPFHNNLAAALIVAGRSQEAIEHCEEALQLQPDLPQAFYNLGKAHMQLGHMDQAIKNYQHAISLKHDYAEAHFGLGNVLFKADRRPEALEQYQLAVRFKSNDSDAHANLAVALACQGRPQEALEHYRQALLLKPDNIDALANLALLYAAIDRPVEAVDAAQKALDSARAQGESALADQILDWLTKYRDSDRVKK